MKKLFKYPYLLAALAISAVLQLLAIDRYSFWFDESYTSALLKYSYSDLISLTAADVHPPLYYMLLKAWSSVFGTSDLALRLPSMLFMLTSNILLFFLIKKLLDGKAASWAVLLASIGTFVVRYGQEARMYGLASVFIMASTLVLVTQMTAKKRSTKLWILYGALITGLIYTHYFGGPIVIAHGLYVWHNAGKLKKIDKAWAYSLLGVGVAYLPWLPTLRSQLSAVNGGFWIPGVSQSTFADTLSQLTIFKEITRSSPWTQAIIGTIFVAAIVYLAVMLVKSTSKFNPALILTLGAIASLSVTLFLVSVLPFTSTYYYLRYFSQFSFLFYGGMAVLAYGLYISKSKNIGLALIAVVALSQLVGVGRVLGGTIRQGQQVDTLYAQIEQGYQSGDQIVTQDYSTYFDVHHYNKTGSPTLVATLAQDYGSLEPIKRRAQPAEVSLDSLSGRIWYVKDASNESSAPDDWVVQRTFVLSGSKELLLYTVN